MSTRLARMFLDRILQQVVLKLFQNVHQTGSNVPGQDTSTSSVKVFPHVHQTR